MLWVRKVGNFHSSSVDGTKGQDLCGMTGRAPGFGVRHMCTQASTFVPTSCGDLDKSFLFALASVHGKMPSTDFGKN